MQKLGCQVGQHRGQVKGNQANRQREIEALGKQLDSVAATDPSEPSFSFMKLTKRGEPLYDFMKLQEDPIEFQLRCMGDFMERTLDGRPDARMNCEGVIYISWISPNVNND